MTLYVGGDASKVQGRPLRFTGPREFSAAHPPRRNMTPAMIAESPALLDSGTFTDPPGRRLAFELALARQLRWEDRAANKWGCPDWHSEAVVSYDLLIDETWTGGNRRKRRWSVADADRAVRETVDAAAYLASQRDRLAPRRLVLSAQGVDPRQYAECAAGVLAHAEPGDWFGLGGWCILGMQRRWLRSFFLTLRLVLPRVAAAGLARVHVFGVLWLPALGGLLWLADRCGLAVSTDSSKPVLDVTRGRFARGETWEANVAWWRRELANLRHSPHYREPPASPRELLRQGELFVGVPDDA